MNEGAGFIFCPLPYISQIQSYSLDLITYLFSEGNPIIRRFITSNCQWRDFYEAWEGTGLCYSIIDCLQS